MHNRPVQDKDTEMAETQTIDAPDWDLADLFNGPGDPAIDREMSALAEQARHFRDTYAGSLPDLAGGEMAAAIASFTSLPIDLRLAWSTFPVARRAVRETDAAVDADRASSHSGLFVGDPCSTNPAAYAAREGF